MNQPSDYDRRASGFFGHCFTELKGHLKHWFPDNPATIQALYHLRESYYWTNRAIQINHEQIEATRRQEVANDKH